MTTQTHRLDPLAARVLRTLFELARHDRPAHAGALARELGIGRTLAADALVRLDRAGLVRAERARLTMHGLLVAARLSPVPLRAPSLVPSAQASATRPPSEKGWLRATGS